jgi:galactose-1-phosphate uridylyltransferase
VNAEDVENLKKVLESVLDSRRAISAEEHGEHHDWVRARIAKERARTEFLTALMQKSLPAIVWSLLAAAGALIWNYLRTHVIWS